MPDKKYFDSVVPGCHSVITRFEDLAEAYRNSTIGPQRDGILHHAAKLGSENTYADTKSSAIFLLEVASERAVVERHPPRRELALSLFVQRVLLRVNREWHSEAHRLTLEFLAEEPKVAQRLAATRGEATARRFLHDLWRPMTGQRTVDRLILIKATIGAAAYELLLMDDFLPTDVIPRLYKELAESQSDSLPELASPVWVTTPLDQAPSIRRQIENPSFNWQFSDDLKKIHRVVGFYVTRDERERNDQLYRLATTLGQLLSVLMAFVYEEG